MNFPTSPKTPLPFCQAASLLNFVNILQRCKKIKVNKSLKVVKLNEKANFEIVKINTMINEIKLKVN